MWREEIFVLKDVKNQTLISMCNSGEENIKIIGLTRT